MWLRVNISQACIYFTVVKKDRNMSRAERAKKEKEAENDLSKLKKKDLLEIMLRQGEEIDSLRAQVADLQAKLDSRDFEFSHIGNIAEASLVVTNVFEEAQKAAVIYLRNVKRMAEQGYKETDETGSRK